MDGLGESGNAFNSILNTGLKIGEGFASKKLGLQFGEPGTQQSAINPLYATYPPQNVNGGGGSLGGLSTQTMLLVGGAIFMIALLR